METISVLIGTAIILTLFFKGAYIFGEVCSLIKEIVGIAIWGVIIFVVLSWLF